MVVRWMHVWVMMVGLVVIVWMNTTKRQAQHFVYLAESLALGKAELVQETQETGWGDMAIYGGKRYVPMGLLPGVMLVPVWVMFKGMGIILYQFHIQPVLVAVTWVLTWVLARRCGWSRGNSLWWVTALAFGSTFLGVESLSSSYEFAQVLAVMLVMVALVEYVGKRRYGVIGVVMGLVFLTRTTAGLGVVFFVMEILRRPGNRLRELIKLGLPVLLAIAVMAGYNTVRFGYVWEQGYRYQQVPEFLEAARNYGLFSLRHVPGNLYYMLLAGPEPVFADGVSHVLKWPYMKINWWGMSIFLTTPYLLILVGKYRKVWRDIVCRGLIITSGVVVVPILLYYGVGVTQFGYRYALDFLPLLFLVCLRVFGGKKKRLGAVVKWLIAGSAILNLYLLLNYIKICHGQVCRI